MLVKPEIIRVLTDHNVDTSTGGRACTCGHVYDVTVDESLAGADYDRNVNAWSRAVRAHQADAIIATLGLYPVIREGADR